jgi:hypothetical protein
LSGSDVLPKHREADQLAVELREDVYLERKLSWWLCSIYNQDIETVEAVQKDT